MSIFFRFSFFKSTKPRQFDPIPRFYDPDKEYIENRLERIREEENAGDIDYKKMKDNIRNNFRNSHTGFGVHRSGRRKNYDSNIRLVIILIILILLTYIFLSAYLPQIENFLK